jgi:Ni/Fe-hydrogenase subunit HybB-like protein
MSETHAALAGRAAWMQDKLLCGLPPRTYARSLATPLNVLAAAILATGLPVLAWRFWAGLGAVTNLTQATPWGLWIGFDMLCGVALAAGGYTVGAAVYILGLRKYEPIVRPAILTGFLGYLFAVLGLLADLGQPWRIWYPLAYSWGTTSVMFEVGWCVALYTTVLFLEFSPAPLEWLGMKRTSHRIERLVVALTVAGVMLSTLHQSSLGALFLMAQGRLHPLWYSGYIPVFFFVSSIAAGLSMVIVETGLSHRLFRRRVDEGKDLGPLVLGLGRGASVVLFSLFFMKLLGLADGGHWALLGTPYGLWFLIGLLGFVLAPCLLFAWAARHGDVTRVRVAAVITVLGVVLNRLDVAILAFDWNAPERYVPSAAEVLVSVTLVTLGLQVYRFIVNRMPILSLVAPESRSAEPAGR